MAGSRTYRTKAIVLDKTKLKETDLILTLVGESGRQIRAVAKGGTQAGQPLGGALRALLRSRCAFSPWTEPGYRLAGGPHRRPLGAQPSF